MEACSLWKPDPSGGLPLVEACSLVGGLLLVRSLPLVSESLPLKDCIWQPALPTKAGLVMCDLPPPSRGVASLIVKVLARALMSLIIMRILSLAAEDSILLEFHPLWLHIILYELL